MVFCAAVAYNPAQVLVRAPISFFSGRGPALAGFRPHLSQKPERPMRNGHRRHISYVHRNSQRIQEELAYDVLVHRYEAVNAVGDGSSSEGATFSVSSFWLVECLTRTGRLEEAQLTLEKMFSYANHLGLYTEEIGPSGEALGNFPQAFAHLSLITAAVRLDRALG
jgi:hypothetical protein